MSRHHGDCELMYLFQRRTLVPIPQDSLPPVKEVPTVPDFWAGEDGHIYVRWKNQWWQKKESISYGNPISYLKVVVPKLGEQRSAARGIHILICETFHGPRPEGYDVSHEDGNSFNNVPTNLKWRTRQDNCLLKELHGTDNKGFKNPNAVLTEDQVRYVRQAREEGRLVKDLSQEFGLSAHAMGQIIRGVRYKNVKTSVLTIS